MVVYWLSLVLFSSDSDPCLLKFITATMTGILIDPKFTPFDCLAAAETTRSGLLKCWDSEIEVSWISSADLYSLEPLVPLTISNEVDETKRDWESTCSELDILITTHRLGFVKTTEQQQQRLIRYVHLSNIFAVTTETFLFKSPKVILQCSVGELVIKFPNASDRTKRRDQCHDQLKIAMQRAQWEQTDGKIIMKQHSTSRRRVGVDAILNANQRRHEQAAHLTDTAFGGDAEQLLREATELVQVIQKYVATLDKGNGMNDNENQELVNLMQGMGMTLHRDDQLARQLADFVRPKFNNLKFITLTDVFCWFNRARGSQLLSPEELLAAVKSMENLNLGIASQTFASGLVVLHETSTSDFVLQEQFLKLCDASGYLTAVQLSQDTHVPAVLAMEQLQLAERNGILVRDETVEAIRFYPNRFDTWVYTMNTTT